jgi:hypothetical protein
LFIFVLEHVAMDIRTDCMLDCMGHMCIDIFAQQQSYCHIFSFSLSLLVLFNRCKCSNCSLEFVAKYDECRCCMEIEQCNS